MLFAERINPPGGSSRQLASLQGSAVSVQADGSRRRSWNRLGAFQATYRDSLDLIAAPFSIQDLFDYGTDRLLVKADSADAISDWIELLNEAPDEDAGWSNLAWVYAITGHTNEALGAEQRAVRLYPYDYTYYVLLGAFSERAGRIADAQEAYSQALQLYPRLAASQFWHALSQRQPTLASSSLQEALKLSEEAVASDRFHRDEVRARLLFAAGQTSQADSIVSSINQELPNVSGMWELQGEIRELQKNEQEAALDYRRAIFLDGTDPLPYERLASLAFKKADHMDRTRGDVVQAWRLVRGMESPSAERRAVQYRRRVGSPNGLLPTTLLLETQPYSNFSAKFQILAEYYQSRGRAKESQQMREFADEAVDYSASFGEAGNSSAPR